MREINIRNRKRISDRRNIKDQNIEKQEDKKNKRKLVYILIVCGLIIVIIILLIIILVGKNKNTVITINPQESCNDNIYDGSTKKLTKLESNDEYTILNNEAIKAGEYKVTIKPNEGYVWGNNSKEDAIITCKIDKATPEFKLDKESIIIDSTSSNTITIETSIEGELSLTADESIIKLDQKEIHKDINPLILNITTIKRGNADIQITFTPTDENYDTITKVVNVSNIELEKINPPTSSICNTVIYNGTSQKLVSKTDYDGYNLKGQLEGTEIGNYQIEAELKDGYIWENGKKDNITITCKIIEKQYLLTFKKNTCKAGQSIFLTISSLNENEKMDIYNSIKNINNNTSITSVIKNSNCQDNALYKGANGIDVSIEASCQYPGQYEIKCLKPGNDTITFNTSNNETLTANVKVNSGDVIKLGTEELSYNGISCTTGKEIAIRVTTYRDGVASNVLKSYSIKDTKYATVSKSKDNPSCNGCTDLIIKCNSKGNTSLVINTKDGTSQSFPIIY